MSQHDYTLDGLQSFPAFHTDLNNAIQALASTNYGLTAPLVTFPGMIWVDGSTSPATIQVRNNANSAWIAVGTVEGNFGATTTAAVATQISTALTNSPALGGNPTATTQTVGNNSTRIASTAFVAGTLSGSPSLGGNPTAPTQATTDVSTRIATTSYVDNHLDARLRAVITRSSDSTVSSFGAWLNVPVNSVVVNNGSEFNTGTFAYTIPQNGVYKISLTCTFITSGGTPPSKLLALGGIRVNSTERIVDSSELDRQYCSVNGSLILNLSSGNTVTPRMFIETVGGSGFTVNLMGTENQPVFSVERLT